MSIRSKENIGKMYNFRFLDENRKITKSSIKQALLPPYPSRYYLNVIIFTVPSILIGLWHYGIIPEHKQGFFCKDPLYSHKYNGDTVAPWMLATVAIFLCFFIYFSIEKIRSKRINELISFVCLTQFYIYFKHFIIGLCLVGGVTEIAKLLVREHRPHFFDTCQPNTNENCTIGTVVLDYTCTNTADSYMDVLEASMSFPSGHSSISWYTALFLIVSI
ncbi:hypothetical protein ABEB36_003221 [Hypothenemus hampei]|uniref:Phosphatidic acid phosphatase type 2/haloperoxidase domain-containing protein n=1 Tax=Hypothenemus hampei TaxID=57062 RepID=A0ABD1F8F0_HYPHA